MGGLLFDFPFFAGDISFICAKAPGRQKGLHVQVTNTVSYVYMLHSKYSGNRSGLQADISSKSV
ncbi:hypothetical protein D7Y05_03690 [bacterium 1XD42-54]|jgi:hypothetical protein|nr:hypothetical protein D7Y05_03690 [bacterium 1XD42-54]